jgi:hypothetical protein
LDPVDPPGGAESGPATAEAIAPAAVTLPTESVEAVAPASTVTQELPAPPAVPSESGWALPGTPAEPTGPTPPGSPPKRSPARMILIGAGILVVIGIVVGVAVAGGGGKKTPVAVSPAASVSASPAAPPAVAPPVGFTAKGQTSPFGVAMSWTAPSGQTVQGYRIYRGTIQIAAVPASATTYLDQNVMPGESYTYAILTRGDGLFQSDKVSTSVKVPVPPLSSARLDGTFSVKFKTTSQSGYVGSLGKFTLGWKFTPKCDAGACNVTVKDLSIKDLKTLLTRKGVSYSGADSAKFIGSCGGVADISALTIVVKVAEADIIGGEWRAIKLTGTVVESHPAVRGCVSGGAHFSITGTYTG